MSNNLQTLLSDLTDKALRRRYEVSCHLCSWAANGLEHERFAVARGKAHVANAHPVWSSKPRPRGFRVLRYCL